MAGTDEIYRAIGSLQSDVKSIANGLEKVERFLTDNARANNEIKLALCRVEDKQEDMVKYQRDCDDERDDIQKRVVSNETDIRDIKGLHSRVMRVVVFFTVTSNVLIGYALEWYKK